MKFREYLASKAVTLCFLGIGGILFGAGAAATSIGIHTIFLFAVLYLCITAAWLTTSFLMERRRLSTLEMLIAELPEKYLLGEVIAKPADPLALRYYRILQEISRSAVGVTERARRDKEDYCDYVESWIHEIKTPLTACNLILANGGDSKKLRQELKRADNLTENILYYARLHTAEADTQIKQFQVAETIGQAVKSQMELLIAANIRVETVGDFSVYSDHQALCFILKQLLINAAKYCPGCRVAVTAENGVITVEDNGIGIPSHELRRVTQRGFTGTNGRRLGGSTGMGLYIVSELCKQLDISLDIQSEQGQYTRVCLRFENLTNL